MCRASLPRYLYPFKNPYCFPLHFPPSASLPPPSDARTFLDFLSFGHSSLPFADLLFPFTFEPKEPHLHPPSPPPKDPVAAAEATTGAQIRELERPFKSRNALLDSHGRDFLAVFQTALRRQEEQRKDGRKEPCPVDAAAAAGPARRCQALAPLADIARPARALLFVLLFRFSCGLQVTIVKMRNVAKWFSWDIEIDILDTMVPIINQDKGIPSTEPTETLLTFRSDKVLRPSNKNKRQVYFVQNLVCKDSLSGKSKERS
ncbi:hypothetical protein U9M48_033896 [Paspalum notatum var. saurae]|uniref:Uncharacterized protein n=1 Tax=Paspalum notatum var. saurae TaxID=547442 RepID=A0AAQ3X787_PASNO